MNRPLYLLCLVPALLLAGCGGPGDAGADARAPVDGAERTQEQREMFTRAGARTRAADATGPARRLQEPLPGGVLPDFEHQLVTDISSRTSVHMRQVALHTRDTSAAEAIDRLAAQFQAAGLMVGQRSEHRGTLSVAAWTAGGAPGHAAPSTGGEYVNIGARDHAADSESARDGMAAVVTISVYSP